MPKCAPSAVSGSAGVVFRDGFGMVIDPSSASVASASVLRPNCFAGAARAG